MKRMSGLSVFELVGSVSGGNLVGENLAGGTDPGGIVGGSVETFGSTSGIDGNVGKDGLTPDKACGVRIQPLGPDPVVCLAGLDKEGATDVVKSKKDLCPAEAKAGPFEPKSWSSLFGKKPTGKSSFPPVTSKACWEKGEFQIFIPDPLVDYSVSSMDFTLVGKFLGARPVLDSLRMMVKRKWALRGEVDIAALQNGFFLFNFNCKEDLSFVLCGGPWSFGKSSLTIKKWEPNMVLNDSFFLTTPIWARLPGLPLEYWHEDIFKGIASSFGELVALDNATATRSKLQTARLLVKVADLNHLPDKVELISKLGKISQEILFDDLPNACYACKRQGHVVKNCPSKHKNHSSGEKEVKKTKAQLRKVWRPKAPRHKEMKEIETLKVTSALVDITSVPLVEDGVRSDSESLNRNTDTESIRADQCFDEQTDLSKQIVLYQMMEDKRDMLDELSELEEGELSTVFRTHSEEDSSQPRELQDSAPGVTQVSIVKDSPILGVIKEEGGNTKPKPRKRAEMKDNSKGVETRSSKLESHPKMNPNVSTPVKSGKKVDQQSKVKPDVGSLDGRGRRSSKKTRELESLQNIADGCQATILDFTPKIWK